ncbi:MAG: colanic acid biosynthesis acetyltransferase WcaF [Bryobacterales bacterium]|nr:colanic acid biosynthesis acetyltransferase WcaF [Bryobacterales bacterium]
MTVDLSTFDNRWYQPGRSRWIQAAWFFFGLPLLRCAMLPSAGLRVFLLRAFGATIGRGVVIKPGVRVKYPWKLTVGDNTWIGEDAWIDNLAEVRLGANVCISQGAYFCTGNHDWTDPAFGLMAKPITVGDGGWVAARALICPGVTIAEGAIAAAGSVISRDIPAWEIHAGNPAVFVARRQLRTTEQTASQPRSSHSGS